MKKLVFVLIAISAMPLNGAMYRGQKPVDVQPMLKQLQAYEQLSAQEMEARSDEINNLISDLGMNRNPKLSKQIQNTVKHYRDVEKKKLFEHRK